jgi:hypothetical protein
MLLTIHPLTLVNFPVRPRKLPDSLRLAIDIVAIVERAIWKNLKAPAVFEPVLPFAFVETTGLVIKDSLAVTPVVYHLSKVDKIGPLLYLKVAVLLKRLFILQSHQLWLF